MRYIPVLLLSIIAFGCVRKHEKTPEERLIKDSLIKALIKTDTEWSDLAGKVGYYQSRTDMITDKSIVLMTGALPLVGRQAIMDYAATHPDSAFSMLWKPIRAEVAVSGDLGYTYGGWTMKMKTRAGADTTLYGNYVTVWQKQEDGRWKFLIDGGTNTPQPVE